MQYIIMGLYVVFSVSGLVRFKLGDMGSAILQISESSFLLRMSWLSVLGVIVKNRL